MRATLWIIITGLLMGCSSSKKLIEKQSNTRNESAREQVKEVITEPLISYIEVPVECPEDQEKPSLAKTYEILSGPTEIKARLQGNILSIKTENKGQSSRDKVVEKILTVDKIHYRDKVERVPYIPKWVWGLVAFNIIYFGWGYRKLLLSLWMK